jgi:hypothetical protein
MFFSGEWLRQLVVSSFDIVIGFAFLPSICVNDASLDYHLELICAVGY